VKRCVEKCDLDFKDFGSSMTTSFFIFLTIFALFAILVFGYFVKVSRRMRRSHWVFCRILALEAILDGLLGLSRRGRRSYKRIDAGVSGLG
jgi:hypothetical protein